MSILGDYLKNDYNDRFFIEVEAKEEYVDKLINSLTEQDIISRPPSEGIVRLGEEQNKYGMEYRVYLKNIEGLPAEIGPVTNNKVYRKEYPYRISKKVYVRPLLFEDGFNLGLN